MRSCLLSLTFCVLARPALAGGPLAPARLAWAQERAQEFYFYFKSDRPRGIDAPAWLDSSLPQIESRVPLLDPEEGALSEAELWRAPASAVYEFFEYASQPKAPRELIADYRDARLRLSDALVRLHQARVTHGLQGRGGALMAKFAEVLARMDAAVAALGRKDQAGYRRAVLGVASLMEEARLLLHAGPGS